MRRTQTGLIVLVLAVMQFGGVAQAATSSQAPSPTTKVTPTAVSSTAIPVPKGPLNITIAPYSQQLVVKPGATITATFQIRNNGLQTERIKTQFKKFSASGENGIPQLSDPAAKDDFISWIHTATPAFDLEPNVWTAVTMTISPPKTAAFGYYYAIDFSRISQPKAAKGNTFVTSVDGLILLDVQAPGEVRKANLAEFSTPNNVVEFLPENFQIRMRNSGNVHVSPGGNIYLYKGKKSVGIIEVNAAGGNILPNSNRVYTARWTDGTPVYKTVTVKAKDGKATDETSLKWDNFKPSKLRFGKYTAELEMVYNNGSYDVPLTARLNFWVIPWRIIIAAMFILMLILAGIWVIFIRPLRGRIKQGNRGNARFRR